MCKAQANKLETAQVVATTHATDPVPSMHVHAASRDPSHIYYYPPPSVFTLISRFEYAVVANTNQPDNTARVGKH